MLLGTTALTNPREVSPIKWQRIQAGYYKTKIGEEDWWIEGPAGTLADGLRLGKYRIRKGEQYRSEHVAWRDTLAEAKACVAALIDGGEA